MGLFIVLLCFFFCMCVFSLLLLLLLFFFTLIYPIITKEYRWVKLWQMVYFSNIERKTYALGMQLSTAFNWRLRCFITADHSPCLITKPTCLLKTWKANGLNDEAFKNITYEERSTINCCFKGNTKTRYHNNSHDLLTFRLGWCQRKNAHAKSVRHCSPMVPSAFFRCAMVSWYDSKHAQVLAVCHRLPMSSVYCIISNSRVGQFIKNVNIYHNKSLKENRLGVFSPQTSS